jgi:choline dehydrogenase
MPIVQGNLSIRGEKTMTNHNYLVVGGGAAGSVLAARLSEDPAIRVLLLEAGPHKGPETMADPAAWLFLWGSEVDWADKTVAQEGSDGAVHAWPRGKVLGGSSAINGVIHLRGHQSSYDRWEELGATGWNYKSLLPFLQRIENASGRDATVRGCSGPMLIAPPPAEPDPLSRAWLHAALEAGYALSGDGNGEVTEGVSWTESNIVDGRRQSAADAYLSPILDRPNLTIVTDAHVTRLVFDGQRCMGAEYTIGEVLHRIEIADEVVLTAGAIGSAQLLMLSGIGPASHLSELGIDVVVDSPGVGRELHDHPMCWITYAAADQLPSTNGVPHILLRSDPASDPDLQIGFAPVPFEKRWAIRPEPGFSVTFSLMSPMSRGSVRLSGTRLHDPLLIDPAYFTDPRDIELMVIAMRRAREIAQTRALAEWRGPALEPEIDWTDDNSCRAYIRRTAGPYFHPVGTCRVGTDDLAVVDPQLRVRGVSGLRVADASVMPKIVSANTHATVLAVAERAATLINARDRKDDDRLIGSPTA